MRRLATGWIVVALMGLYTLPAKGQGFVGWYPVQRPAYQPVMRDYAPAPVTYAPAENAGMTVSTRWEPAEPAPYAAAYTPAVTYAPAVNYTPAMNYVPAANYAPAMNYAPAVPYVPVAARCATPRVSYMPVAARYPAPNYVTYAPVANNYAAAPAPAYAGPKVWVHPKVYVEGQPIRNLLRAITP